MLSQAMERISATKHGERGAAFEEEAKLAGVSAKRLHNLYTKWKRAKTDDERILALADGRKLAAASRPNPWLPVYKRYCENDKNTDRGGWEAMRRDFLAGTLTVPGVGNWIQAWQAENAFGDISELRDPVTGALRPPEGWMPRGATYGNLSELARRDPDRRFNLAFNRLGRRAAHRFLLPVLQSRAGVTVGEITQFDDVWLNDDVIVDGRVCRPLAFVGYDYASAYQCARAMKPRVRNEETGRMKNLNEYDFRCLLACHCCRTGFWRRRARFVLEHGTTAIRNDRTTPVRDNIMATARLLGFNVELCESGILSEQAHAGLLKGCGGGNFRMKALCEGSHNVLHNALASLPGSHGRDAEHLHESNAALVKYEQWLLDAAGALDPVFAAKLVAGLQTWGEYEAAYDTICREVMKRSDHRLVDHAQHGITKGSIGHLHRHRPCSGLRKHQQTGSHSERNTTVKKVSTILSQLGIAVINITSHDRTPETVNEANRKNQSADEGGIDFQYRSQVNHQVGRYCLEDQVLCQVARAKADALDPG